MNSSLEKYYDLKLIEIESVLPPEYSKLVKKVLSLFGDNSSNKALDLKFLLEIDETKFSNLAHVGRKYLYLLEKFQKDCYEFEGYFAAISRNKGHASSNESIFHDCLINQAFLTKAEISSLRKMFGSKAISAQDVLNISKIELEDISGIGKSTFESLLELKSRVFDESIQLLSARDTYFSVLTPRLLVDNTFNQEITFDDLETALIEDIEDYLFSLDEFNQFLAQARWGYNHEHLTLEEVGQAKNITRERVRQIERKINSDIIKSIRIPTKVILNIFSNNLNTSIELALPNFSACFDSKSSLYQFIEMICGIEKNELFSKVKINFRTSVLDDFFAQNESPILLSDIIYELLSNQNFNSIEAWEAVEQLRLSGIIKIINDTVYPCSLMKKEAAAHVMLSFQHGLPWKDIAKLVNLKNICSSKLDEERLISSYTSDSEYLYQSDRGCYKHMKYFPITEDEAKQIIDVLINFLKSSKTSTVHVNDFYQNSTEINKKYSYFDIRHVVREYSGAYGLVFTGKSGVDSVSLEKNATSLSQYGLILQLLNESKFALTTAEIGAKLRSNSTHHARFYLNQLINDNQVVRIDSMLYTLPEKAFSGLDIESILYLVDDFLLKSKRIVEMDTLKNFLNYKLELFNSKYYYSSLIQLNKEEFGWYKNGLLISLQPIKYNSLYEAINSICNLEISNELNKVIINKELDLTERTCNSMLSNWRAQSKLQNLEKSDSTKAY